MNVTKVTRGGAIHFELRDNRIGAVYPSGYVRVSTKQHRNYRRKNPLMYQINKQVKDWYDKTKPFGYNIKRVKVDSLGDGFRLLQRFEDNNCGDSSRVLTEGFKCDSLAIESAQYRINDKRLTVFFKNGSIYNYSKVPQQVYNDFRLSNSKGGFLNETLKQFNFKRLTPKT